MKPTGRRAHVALTMKLLFLIVLPLSLRRRFRGRPKILIEPDPQHIRSVFERSGETGVETVTPWRWPRDTWFQQRREKRRAGART